jgi:hypothetical protein
MNLNQSQAEGLSSKKEQNAYTVTLRQVGDKSNFEGPKSKSSIRRSKNNIRRRSSAENEALLIRELNEIV